MSSSADVPLNPFEPGTTLFVEGHAADSRRALALLLLLRGKAVDHGTIVLTTEVPADRVRSICEQVNPDHDRSSELVIDCTGTDAGTSTGGHGDGYGVASNDLSDLGIKFSVVHENLLSEGQSPVLAGMVSLTRTLERLGDLRAVIRFVQMVSGRIEAAGGLGVFALDPGAHDDVTLATLRHVFDGGVELREGDDGPLELRARELPEQPEGWNPCTVFESSG